MITIEELAARLCRKPASVIRRMKSRGYLDENGKPSTWCIEGKIMSEDGRISKRGESLLSTELGIGKIPKAELKTFLSKSECWACHGKFETGAFVDGKIYTSDQIIDRYYRLQEVQLKIDCLEDEPGFSIGNCLFTMSKDKDWRKHWEK
ncbi:MAG: hypothetical protein J5857_03190 [Treponema sp.]|nr:hypothetical protein [Treponema sp.]